MPAGLSLDLRKRIVEAHRAGEGSIDEIAERFRVSSSSVRRFLERFEATGSVAPTPQRHGPKPIVEEEHAALLETWLKEEVSLRQVDLAERFHKHTGTPISQQTISRELARRGITRKKSR